MKSSITILSFSGIPLKLHWSFFLLIGFLIYFSQFSGFDPTHLGWFSGYVVGLFVCVALHEYGHALTAKHYGLKTKDILITPIAGLARLESLPANPIHELWIALAGPLVNLALAFLFYASSLLLPPFSWLPESMHIIQVSSMADFLKYLGFINLALCILNLIPAFPMDGGRILRAGLTTKLGKEKATKISGTVGFVFAAIFILGGLIFGDVVWIALGFLILFTARVEAQVSWREETLAKYCATDIMRTNFTRLHLGDTYAKPAQLMLQNAEHNFLVFDSLGYPVGVVPQLFIIDAIRNNTLDQLVMERLSSKIFEAASHEKLNDLSKKMDQQGISLILIKKGDLLLGVIDRPAILNILEIERIRL